MLIGIEQRWELETSNDFDLASTSSTLTSSTLVSSLEVDRIGNRIVRFKWGGLTENVRVENPSRHVVCGVAHAE